MLSNIQSPWLFSTVVTSASTDSPNFCRMTSGFPAGCAADDHTLKYGLRTSLISLFGAYSAHMYGPVPAGGMFRFLSGVDAGRMNANGTASWSRNSGSLRARWKVTVFPRIVIPFDRSHVFGVFTHASPPTMTLYQAPALGLSPILKSRTNVALTSCGVTVLPLENLIPERSVKVYVLPPSVGLGTAVARSGTITVPAFPAARRKPTSPSWVRMRSCHSWSV